MNILYYLIWLLFFVVGLVLSYSAPESVFSYDLKFIFIGLWGSVASFLFYVVAKRALLEKEILEPTKENTPKLKDVKDIIEEVNEEKSIEDKTNNVSQNNLDLNQVFPLEEWNVFCKQILRNRPFSEVVEALETVLPKLFPHAAGVLYMYGDAQAEMHKIFSFGDYVISDDVITPIECGSFNLGDIVVNDYSSEKATVCTHLRYHNQGISFCAPIEGLEEHFGILCVQTDEFPSGEDINFWKTKISIVSATFGLYVANQNLNIRFQQHSIRDSLSGLYNKRYMEESLRREVFSASRHDTPIGIIMLYPDAVPEIQEKFGIHAVEQILWELGGRLPNYIRNEDIPCRYEGNVFCVIMPGADYKTTKNRAEKIGFEISQLQIAYGKGILRTTLSMGISIMPAHATDAKSLIAIAEVAMKSAINKGGNCIVSAERKRDE